MKFQTKILIACILLLGCVQAQNQHAKTDSYDGAFVPYSTESINKKSDEHMHWHKIFTYNTVTNVPGGVVMQSISCVSFDTAGSYTSKDISTSNVFIPGVQAIQGPDGKYKLEKIPGKEPKNLEG